MIGIREVKEYCRDDISKIENYEQAVNSPEKWDCHHRDEIRTLPSGMTVYRSREELIENDRYYNCPAYELIFLKHSEHTSLHRKGKTLSEEHKQKLRENHGGGVTQHSEETKRKMSESMKGKNKGKTHSEETKQRISESNKGQVAWNKGKKLPPLSEETKQKCREKRIAYWAKKRALKNASLNTL